jgi:hypothetical protein
MTHPSVMPATLEEPVAPSPPALRLHGRWLFLARGLWLVLAAGMLETWIFGLMAYSGVLRTVCPPSTVQCPLWQLTPANVLALRHLGLSVAAYANAFIAYEIVVSLVFILVGALIFWRKSHEWLGLVVSFLLLLFGTAGISDTLAVMPPAHTPAPLVALATASGICVAVLQWPGLGFFLVTFPTGRFVPRWSWAIVLLWVAQLAFFWIDSLGLIIWPVWLFIPVVGLTWGSTMVVQLYRYRRAYSPVERQQTKWLVFGVSVAVLIEVISSVAAILVPGLNAADSPYQLLSGFFAGLMFMAIPLALGTAILRYRLWDIDVIIRLTLIYGALTAILAAVYFGVVIAAQSLGEQLTGELSPPAWVIVLSTLLIAALFNPLRHLLQTVIDRRFYRSKYDAVRTLEAFAMTLRTELDLAELSAHLLDVVQETMQPTHVSLWLRGDSPPETPGPPERHP